MNLTADTEIRYVPGVGPKIAEKLAKLGIERVHDLLYHVPFRYNDFSLISPINAVQPGETVTVQGTMQSIKTFVTKNGKRIQQARVRDETGVLAVTWFNQPYLLRVLKQNQTYYFSGTVNWFGNTVTLSSPQFEPAGDSEDPLHTGRLVPVYHETEGISSKRLRSRISYVLEHAELPQDHLPQIIQSRFGLMPLDEAIRSVHFPHDAAQADKARYRLAFDELLSLHIASYEYRRAWQKDHASRPFTLDGSDRTGVIQSLPFTLTGDQEQAVGEVFADLEQPIAMNRLLVGDVGSGKTVVAALAMYAAYRNGAGSVLMAPTQILAEQHHKTLTELFGPLGIPVDIMTAERKTVSTGKTQRPFGSLRGEPVLVVGTHAVLKNREAIGNLGLVVIDEQHRFGVSQRSTLMERDGQGLTPHMLTMTATPIPRTLAKTVFGHMDVSVIATLPKGRKTVKTWVVPDEKRDNAYRWIKDTHRQTGGQVFIIYPLIEESQSETLLTVKAVKAEYEALVSVFSDMKVGLLHGRLPAKEKTKILSDFAARAIDILVSTPVVEVGIDIPNAAIMVVESADRFGLGQLHQLRGRVGRGTLSSYCLLFTDSDDPKTIERLKSLETIHSGPLLAEVDLKLRGPGQMFGLRQHGLPELRIAEFGDLPLIRTTKEALTILTKDDADLNTYPLLRAWAKKSTIVNAKID